MSGDAAMEETLFLVKPELMVAMALQCRMVDTEAVCVSGARKFSLTSGFGQSFRFAGDYDGRRKGPPPKVLVPSRHAHGNADSHSNPLPTFVHPYPTPSTSHTTDRHHNLSPHQLTP